MLASVRKDVVLGGLLIAIGGAAATIASGYPQGSVRFMGPGFVPLWLARLLSLLGALIVLRGLSSGPDDRPLRPYWRGLILVPASVVVFGLIVPRLGLLLATLLACGLVAAALTEGTPRQHAGTAVGLAGFLTLLFAYLLKVPLPVWPS